MRDWCVLSNVMYWIPVGACGVARPTPRRQCFRWLTRPLSASQIPTRTVVQIRTHAQKYFQKLQKDGFYEVAGDAVLSPLGYGSGPASPAKGSEGKGDMEPDGFSLPSGRAWRLLLARLL